MNMASDLPEDVLHLICEELKNRDDFATLYSCAIAGKVLAPIAISHLYRYVIKSTRVQKLLVKSFCYTTADIAQVCRDLPKMKTKLKLLVNKWSYSVGLSSGGRFA